MPETNKYSIIKLYKDCKIIETENFIVDDIETYLISLSVLSKTQSQIIKHALDLTLRVDLGQEHIGLGEDYDNYNYIAIKNDIAPTGETANNVYYFVRKKTWLSVGAIEFELHMDVINTFKSGVSFTISDRTLIKREHKNRFEYIPQYQEYYPVIDLYSEGINGKLYRRDGTYKEFTNDVSEHAPNFYLIYKNSKVDSSDQDNVVNCFLATDGKLKSFKPSPQGASLTINDFEVGKYYYFLTNTSHFSALSTDGVTTYSFTPNTWQMARVYKYQVAGVMYLRMDLYTYGNSILPYDHQSPTSNIVHNISNVILQTGDIMYTLDVPTGYRDYVWENGMRTIISSTDLSYPILDYSEINKTDSRIIKILKLPYAPTQDIAYDSTNQVITFDTNKWVYDYDENLIRLVEGTEFKNSHLEEDVTEIYPLINEVISPASKYLLDLREDDIEPKIFHSDFYQVKYYYDSFSINIALEQYIWRPNVDTFSISFIMTKTINSKFMFSLDNLDLKYPTEDYPDYLIVQRNNEEVIYNSEYINYLRAGFNYDVKSKNLQETFSWLTAGAGVVGGILSVAFGSKTIGVGLISSSVLSIAGAIKTTISAETNLQAKMQSLKWQSNSVYGADDVDLMSHYANNKLRRGIYQVSPRLENLLKDLFYYTGYIESRMAVPDVTTRSWFNFLSCELKFSSIANMPDKCREELIAKYDGGVVFLHHHKVNNVDMWDFERVYANWETFLVQ